MKKFLETLFDSMLVAFMLAMLTFLATGLFITAFIDSGYFDGLIARERTGNILVISFILWTAAIYLILRWEEKKEVIK